MLYEIKYRSQNTSSLTDLVSSSTCSSEVRRKVNKLSGLRSSVTPSQPNGTLYGQHIVQDKIKYCDSLGEFLGHVLCMSE